MMGKRGSNHVYITYNIQDHNKLNVVFVFIECVCMCVNVCVRLDVNVLLKVYTQKTTARCV